MYGRGDNTSRTLININGNQVLQIFKVLKSPLNNSIYLNVSFALVGALSFSAYSYLVILNGHFHEGAYILFKYIENFVAGNGISFSPDLIPAEGATAFLWLILLSLFHALGADIGSASIFVNAIGVLLIIFF